MIAAAPHRALIAEDEPLLAQGLRAELARCWPELELLPIATDGDAALDAALAAKPDVLFLDIRMPGRTGLDVAEALADDWPDDTPLPLICFVTAYDAYAVQAFDRAAVDYLLKPVQPARLAATCERLRSLLAARQPQGGDAAVSPSDAAPAGDPLIAQLRSLLGAGAAPAPKLTVIQASAGNTVHMVPVDDVQYFEAADKYVRVVTADAEYLIRTSLRELLHRSVVVQARTIARATRDEAGKVRLSLRQRPESLTVSRVYAHLFKGM